MNLHGFSGAFKGLILAGVAIIFVMVVFVHPSKPETGSGREMADLGLADFVQTEMTYDGVMHELYWHYEFANQMIRIGRMDDARAHLKMLTFYINLLPYLSREKKFFKDPVAVKKFDSYAQDLIGLVDQIGKNLGAGNTEAQGQEMQKRIDYLCFHCHKDLKTPIREITPYGKKIEMGPAGGNPQGGRTRIHR